MTSRSRWLIVLISTPLVILVTVGGLIGAPRTAPQEAYRELRTFQEVAQLIAQAYVENPDFEKVMEGAMHGLTDGLDPSSAYLTPDEVRAVEARGTQPTGDVGLVVTRQFYLRVLGVRDGSPAAKAGLQTGDYLRMVDGRPTRDMSAFTGTRLLRGANGSKVSVTVIRGNTADPHVIELTRETIPAESATVKPLTAGVAHVRVAGFGPGTAAALKRSSTDWPDRSSRAR